jgi:hypothetical protein
MIFNSYKQKKKENTEGDSDKLFHFYFPLKKKTDLDFRLLTENKEGSGFHLFRRKNITNPS